MLKFLRKKKQTPEQAICRLLADYELPTFPVTVMNTLKLLRDPDAELKQIADTLEVDPGMQVRILRTVNSAAFGLSNRISNIQHAASLLGRSRLESLVVSVAVKDALPTSNNVEFNRQFWLCASRRACIGRSLAEILHPTTQTEAFAACLLQDIAVPVLFTTQEAYRSVYAQWLQEPGSELDALEREALGYDHAAVGALFAEQWGLGDYLISAIADHHDSSGEANIDAAITLAAPLRPDPENDGSQSLIELAHSVHNLCRDRVHGLLQSSSKNASEFASMMIT
jgi:HD-like signal output (HDOD) protein